MGAFRVVLERHEVDGIWLDYHHSHASWEQAVPNLPDTCFCERCVARFSTDTGIRLPSESAVQLSRRLLGEHRQTWTQWRCDLFTDWVREFHEIRKETRPAALLGVWALWSALSILWSEDMLAGLRWTSFLVMMSGLAIGIALICRERRRAQVLLWALLGAFALACLVAVAEVLTGLHLPTFRAGVENRGGLIGVFVVVGMRAVQMKWSKGDASKV